METLLKLRKEIGDYLLVELQPEHIVKLDKVLSHLDKRIKEAANENSK